MTDLPTQIGIIVQDAFLDGYQSAIDRLWAMAEEIKDDPQCKRIVQTVACALENMKP